MNDPVFALMLVLRLTLGSYFLLSGTAKVVEGRVAVAEAIGSYRLVPRPFAAPLATLLPAIEIVLGLGLIAGLAAPATPLLMALMLVLFSGAVVGSLFRGQLHACGCMGALARRQVSWSLVAQNSVLAAGALLLGIGDPASRQPIWELLGVLGVSALNVLGLSFLSMMGLILWGQADATFQAYRGWTDQLTEPLQPLDGGAQSTSPGGNSELAVKEN